MPSAFFRKLNDPCMSAQTLSPSLRSKLFPKSSSKCLNSNECTHERSESARALIHGPHFWWALFLWWLADPKKRNLLTSSATIPWNPKWIDFVQIFKLRFAQNITLFRKQFSVFWFHLLLLIQYVRGWFFCCGSFKNKISLEISCWTGNARCGFKHCTTIWGALPKQKSSCVLLNSTKWQCVKLL